MLLLIASTFGKSDILQKLAGYRNFILCTIAHIAGEKSFSSYSTTILTIYQSSVGKAFWFFSLLDAQQEEYARSAKPGIEPRLALQQASAIHTLYALSYAASSKLRCTLRASELHSPL
jgi:hypothetical protein